MRNTGNSKRLLAISVARPSNNMKTKYLCKPNNFRLVPSETPSRIQKMEPPAQYEPITTLGKLGNYKGVPFFGSFRGSGFGCKTAGNSVIKNTNLKLHTPGACIFSALLVSEPCDSFAAWPVATSCFCDARSFYKSQIPAVDTT